MAMPFKEVKMLPKRRLKLFLCFSIKHPSMLKFFLSYPFLLFEIFKHPNKRSLKGTQYISTLHAYYVRSQLHQVKKKFNKLYPNLLPVKDTETVGKVIQKLNSSRYLRDGHYFWNLLYILCRLVKPKIVVETGVSQGTSSAYILQALEDNGEGFLYSIDLPGNSYVRDNGKLWVHMKPPGFKPGCSVPKELYKRWKLILGSSEERLPSLLQELGGIDVFIHDSEHTYKNMMFEYTWSWRYLRPGGILISDDIYWSLAFYDFCRAEKLENYGEKGVGICIKE